MPAQLIITLVLGLLAVLLVIAILILIVAYSSLTKKIRYVQKENTYLKNHVHERSVEVLDEARKRALALLEDAEKKAKEMISSATAFNQNATKVISDTLSDAAETQAQAMDKTTQTLVTEYSSSLAATEKEDMQVLQNITKDIESTTEKEFADFKSKLVSDAANIEKAMTNEIVSTNKQVQDDMSEYKKIRLGKVDAQINAILAMVSEDVFGKVIPLQDHQAIILDALEHAKKELGGSQS